MEDTFVSQPLPLLKVLSDRLNSLHGVAGEQILRKMALTVAEIETLVVGPEKLLKEHNLIERWLAEVKLVAYETDDFLDEFELYLVEKKAIKCFPFSSHFKLERKLMAIEAKFSQLVRDYLQGLDDRSILHLRAAAQEDFDSVVDRGTISFIDESEVFGRHFDKETIVDFLLNNSGGDDYNRRLSVVSIIGMGGIGKTTLAQLAFNDDRVIFHFHLRVWVSVPGKFDVMRLGKAILEAATLVRHDDISNLVALCTRLKGVFHSKKFLIVFDDYEDDGGWCILWILSAWLNVGASRSKVVVTARSAYAGALTFDPNKYFLEPLSDDDCWYLFRSISFSLLPDEEKENGNLEEIGRKIAYKCQGLPLAIKTMAALLRFKSDWLSILNDSTWVDLGEPIISYGLPVLRLCYKHLPSHLKQCFAFCSVFPKHYAINRAKLIQWWIANGFVRSTGGGGRGRTLEETGNEYFEELLERSFFTDIARDDYGDIVECRMHNLFHDLARCAAGNSCYVMDTGVPQNIPSNEFHHSSLVCLAGPSIIPEELLQAKTLRTLLLLSGKFSNIPSIFKVSRCLRVLDFSNSGLHALPVSVAQNLIHLRYLDLSCTYIETLPRSICKLKFLQTLELFGCYNLRELPKAISQLTNLRHLGIQSCPLLTHMPFGMWKLRLLQTLPTFILGKTEDCGRLNDLSGLNLRGRLEIKNLENVKILVEAHVAKLYEKTGLNSLGLSWGQNLDNQMSVEVLESLRPSQYLKVLDIIGYGGLKFPSWLWDSNLHLVKLSLINCSCQQLPPLGQLPHLRDLHMKGLSEVRCIGKEFYGDGHIVWGFPSLKELELYNLPNLLKWKSFSSDKNFTLIEIEESYVSFPCLDTLSIKGCTNLIELPLLPSLRKLALSNCNTMMFRSLAHLTSLSSLVIDEFQKPMSWPVNLGRLNSIKTLTIYDCDDVVSLLNRSVFKFSSLEHLSILGCDKLESLPSTLKYLTSLRKLEIVECHELVDITDIGPFLCHLKELRVEGCPNLNSLSDDIILRA